MFKKINFSLMVDHARCHPLPTRATNWIPGHVEVSKTDKMMRI